MYKAIEHQLSLLSTQTSVPVLRKQTSDHLRAHQDDYLPFLTSDKTGDIMTPEEFDRYCSNIEKTKVWGGHIELRALSEVLKHAIEVVQADSPPIIIGDTSKSSKKLLVSYHRHAFSLGEHYNSLLKS
jgi:OTU domain-containing protein 6